ncbi:PASTA domain-containing protein [Vagococcus salmoninarum]|uniref:PASTA domain-containing protein n=1 Tax=Vagococcus salmoninarum TaxID=2739 RepID=UPI0028D1DE1B|nr:PASTA domain-containing protein [Vagococcus salmoninarum]
MSNFLTSFESKKPEQDPPEKVASSQIKRGEEEVSAKPSRSHRLVEEIEIDRNYQKKKRKFQLKIMALVILLLVVSAFGVYQLTHVTMPDFHQSKLEDVRSWASENRLKIETTGVYDLTVPVNQVVKQPIKKQKKVKKGSTLTFVVSQGADPEEILKLPDFSKLKVGEAEKWLTDNQVEKLKIVNEADSKIAKGTFLKLELKEEELTDSFKRKDSGVIYYSSGKEVLKKDIVVPDFSGKSKADIAAWGKTNEVVMTFKYVANDDVESDLSFAQSVPSKEKVAKQAKITVSLSAGKGIIVPDFSQLTAEEALTQKGVEVTVKQAFNLEVPYGQLIWQSTAAETELTSKDDLGITVTYSAGQPYLKDVVGETEGDLQKIFYDEYTSKGANIGYLVNYVSSEEKPGTVVSMSDYNKYVPLDYTVTINISNGK